ncbi:MAG: hypothetical protein ABR542_11850 [Desulfonatronovibrio sp.]|nr:hypothetical protein [Desulfovibrionales bacterium]
MRRTQGEKVLKELFESSDWKEKYEDQLPQEDIILYKWSADEAEYAAPFFSTTGKTILTEETCIAKRSLYLGRDGEGTLFLYICEQEKESYRKEIPDMAKEFACLMKVDNFFKEK